MATEVAVLGAGMAGLGAVNRLAEMGVRPTLYEKRPDIGGHTSSYEISGFTFDEGPHISFTKNQRVKDLLAESIAGAYFSGKAYVNNYWQGHWIPHPAQVHLHGLPTDLVVDIIADFVDAGANKTEIRDYRDWLYAQYGKRFAETFPMRYTEKYHTLPAEQMALDWIGPRMYRPSLQEVLQGAMSTDSPNVHYIEEFRYPKHGGFAAYLPAFARKADTRVGHELVALEPRKRELRFRNGHVARYDRLISSMPLPALVPMIAGAPPDVLSAAAKLACSEVVIVTLGVNRQDLIDAHWTYFYDLDFAIVRLSTPHLQSVNNAPPGCGLLQAEIYFSAKYKPRRVHPDELIDVAIRDLNRCGILRPTDEILLRHAMLVPYANVIFDHDCAPALRVVHGFLEESGIAWCGRYGDWAYLWTDESFLSGERAAEKAMR